MKQESQLSRGMRYFSLTDEDTKAPTPWHAAFPNSGPLGYYQAYEKKCSKVTNDPQGVVDEDTARKVWISILKDYEDYKRMGMWLPDKELDEHRLVAIALGWY